MRRVTNEGHMMRSGHRRRWEYAESGGLGAHLMASSASMGGDEDRGARLRNVQQSSVTPRAVSLRQEDYTSSGVKRKLSGFVVIFGII